MAHHVNIVSFNLSRSSHLLTEVRLILESARCPCIEFSELSIDGWEANQAAPAIAQVLSEQTRDAMIVMVDSDQFERAIAILPLLRKAATDVPMTAIVDTDQPEEVWKLMQMGADDVIVPPLSPLTILPRLWRLMERATEEESVIQRLKEKLGLHQFIGRNPDFVAELQKIPVIAKCSVGVLISGETGTGKELVARAIHYLSPQAHKPFVPVNCGAIPAELAENELFGHEQGAFTGAHAQQLGLIQQANEGTLFLDDVDCLPLSVQMKLLRFLQEKEYRMLGSTQTRTTHVRVIAASNTPLEAKVEEGSFRQDLYYRLKVVSLTLPPLRRRPDDIISLAQHFRVKYATEFDKHVTGFSEGALQKLCMHTWPGNVRELENMIAGAMVLCEKSIITEQDLAFCQHVNQQQETYQQAKKNVVNEFEKRYVQSLLALHQGNISKAASTAQKNRRAFWEIIRKHNIDVQKFRAPEPQGK